MNLSLAHPSCCDCLQCLNRRNPERLISPENFNDVADAAEVVSAERPSASVPALNGSRSPEHTGVLVAGQSKRLDCEALISQIPCGLALTAEKTSGPAPVGFAGKAGSVSGAPRVESEVSNTTYHTSRGGNSNGLHVTQGSAPESDRHREISVLDRARERNGCVAQMDMPRTRAVTGDGSSTSPEYSDDSLYLFAEPSTAELEVLDDHEDPLAPARGVIFAACMGGIFILSILALVFFR